MRIPMSIGGTVLLKRFDERSHAFVVRIWEERRDLVGAPPAWRGSVEAVQGGERLYFATLQELCFFIAQYSGMSPDSGFPPPEVTPN